MALIESNECFGRTHPLLSGPSSPECSLSLHSFVFLNIAHDACGKRKLAVLQFINHVNAPFCLKVSSAFLSGLRLSLNVLKARRAKLSVCEPRLVLGSKIAAFRSSQHFSLHRARPWHALKASEFFTLRAVRVSLVLTEKIAFVHREVIAFAFQCLIDAAWFGCSAQNPAELSLARFISLGHLFWTLSEARSHTPKQTWASWRGWRTSTR